VRSVSLAVGERHELTLRGLGSAGYSWNVEVEGPEGVVAIERRPSGPPPEKNNTKNKKKKKKKKN
jgi:predicted secreted protein